MKIKSLVFGIVAALSLSATVNAATVYANGGKVRFEGSVVNAACAVDASSMDQTVQMGQVRTAKLATLGQTSTAVGFNIILKDCDTSVSTKAAVAFLGTTAASNSTALAVDESAAGNATNVGIQILDSKSTALALDGNTYSAQVALIDGTNTLPFQARYIATGAGATAGTANAEATFKIQYN